jgi:hypothetical protein
MSQPLEFTATFEFRRPGSSEVVATTKTSGTVAIPLPSGPAPAPAPAPVAPSGAGPLGSRVKFGAFVHDGQRGDPWDPTPHFELEKRIGRELDPVSWFIGWDVDLSQVPLKPYGKRSQLISWHPDQVHNVAEILGGKWDAFFTRFAASVDNFSTASGATVYVRLMPEMNGNWARWSAANGALGITSPKQFVQVWQYIVDKVSRRTNKVRWVWCPNITDEPNAAGNRMEEYWPGAAYVHVLGFDGYNWGDGGHFRWTSFVDLVGSPQGGASKSIYERLCALHPTMAIWLCEFGSKDPTKQDDASSPPNAAHSKSQWYIDMLRCTAFPRLTTVVAFDIAKERDWRLASSLGVVEAVSAHLTK